MNWYAIQLSGNALEVKQRKIGYWGPKEGRYIVPIQKGKLVIDKSMADLGVELYLPWETKRIIHHRSKRAIDRDFPLIPGYAFVKCNPLDCHKVAAADGVSGIMSYLRDNKSRMPEIIKPKLIHQLRMAEYALYREHLDKYKPLTRRKLSKKFQKGDQLKPKQVGHIGKVGVVNATTGRKTVKTTIEMFGTMVAAEISVNLVDVA